MHLVVGLGNPDGKYLANRHNAGFMVLDAIARAIPLLIEGADDAFQTKVTHLAPAPADKTE